MDSKSIFANYLEMDVSIFIFLSTHLVFYIFVSLSTHLVFLYHTKQLHDKKNSMLISVALILYSGPD